MHRHRYRPVNRDLKRGRDRSCLSATNKFVLCALNHASIHADEEFSIHVHFTKIGRSFIPGLHYFRVELPWAFQVANDEWLCTRCVWGTYVPQ